MPASRDDYKEAGSWGTFLGLNLVAWIVVFFVISILLSVGYLAFEKYRQNRLTDITRQTNQYVTTQQQMMLTWAEDYAKVKAKAGATNDANTRAALELQAMALCDQIKRASIGVEEKYWPPSAKVILQGGCQ